MQISKTFNAEKLTLALTERLDTLTAPELEQEISALNSDVKELTLNLEELNYISSAGLRVVLIAHKKLKTNGGQLIIRNPNEIVQEVFEMTGFADMLTIE